MGLTLARAGMVRFGGLTPHCGKMRLGSKAATGQTGTSLGKGRPVRYFPPDDKAGMLKRLDGASPSAVRPGQCIPHYSEPELGIVMNGLGMSTALGRVRLCASSLVPLACSCNATPLSLGGGVETPGLVGPGWAAAQARLSPVVSMDNLPHSRMPCLYFSYRFLLLSQLQWK